MKKNYKITQKQFEEITDELEHLALHLDQTKILFGLHKCIEPSFKKVVAILIDVVKDG